jgi:hypothetical protein
MVIKEQPRHLLRTGEHHVIILCDYYVITDWHTKDEIKVALTIFGLD